jgi:glycosyltransferase involved in cell wall biosynthesis
VSRPLRVVLTHPTAWPDVHRGAERYVHELAAGLVDAGHHVTVITTSATPGRREVLGVPVVALPPGRPEMFGVRCAALVARLRPDVWHANSLYDAAAAAMLPGVRSVATAHGPITTRSLRSRRRRVAFAIARRADAWVCVSRPAAEQAAREAGLTARVVPPGVDLGAFTPGGRRADHPVVLYVGTLASPRKNVALLMDGAAEALRVEPHLELWLAGSGDCPTPPPALARAVRQLGLITGSALVDAYRSAWATALVSEREVFGMAVVESLACGTPAVVLDDGWGPAGIIAEATGARAPATPAGVGAAITRALRMSREAGSGDRCRAAAAEYSWSDRVVPAMLEVYAGG